MNKSIDKIGEKDIEDVQTKDNLSNNSFSETTVASLSHEDTENYIKKNILDINIRLTKELHL